MKNMDIIYLKIYYIHSFMNLSAKKVNEGANYLLLAKISFCHLNLQTCSYIVCSVRISN